MQVSSVLLLEWTTGLLVVDIHFKQSFLRTSC